MAEIYRDKTGLGVTLDVSTAVVTNVVFKRDGEETAAAAVSPVPIPYSITHMDGPFDVVWTYTLEGDTYTRTDVHKVVTPLFSKAELIADDASFAATTDPQYVKLEGFIRAIIEAYTGQTFGWRKGWVEVYGNGDTLLNSPERIIALDSQHSGYRPVNSGFSIEGIGRASGGVNIKVPGEEEAAFGGVIQVPYYRHGYFDNNVKYKVTGEFGWTTVPQDVKRAALILAEAFSCDESMWQDRYIKSIRAADWRFDFGDGAFIGTGSYSADQLLAKYIVNRLAVV